MMCLLFAMLLCLPLLSQQLQLCASPPLFFVCLASPSILLVFFCVLCPALPQLCTLLDFFFFLLVSFLWFWVSLSSFLLLSPLLEPSLLFFFVVCQVPAGGRSCNTTKRGVNHRNFMIKLILIVAAPSVLLRHRQCDVICRDFHINLTLVF